MNRERSRFFNRNVTTFHIVRGFLFVERGVMEISGRIEVNGCRFHRDLSKKENCVTNYKYFLDFTTSLLQHLSFLRSMYIGVERLVIRVIKGLLKNSSPQVGAGHWFLRQTSRPFTAQSLQWSSSNHDYYHYLRLQKKSLQGPMQVCGFIAL